MADIVVGSGPAGIAATHALLARGRPVILVDGGKGLEPERRAARDRLAGAAPAAWPAAERAAYVAAQRGARPGQVRRFGSDFAMESPEATFADPGPVALRASRAAGGLSNLWGTAVLSFAARDMQGWPIGPHDLAPHARAVLGFLPVSGRVDALAALFPDGLPAKPQPVAPTVQATRLLERLAKAEAGLAAIGLRAGMARQAVAAGCRRCGLCLNGCPWGLMWSAASELPALAARPGFSYRPGAAVRAIEAEAGGVICRLEDGAAIRGNRVFLAAGVLETARILLASGLAGDRIELSEARHAFLPALQWPPAAARPDRLPLTTLPQVFLELDDPAVSPFLVHGQVYTWNEQYQRDLAASYGSRLPGSGPLWGLLARQLVVTQIFLHSDHWPRIALSLATDGRLNATVEGDGDAPVTMARAAQAMGRGLRRAGLAALTFALRHDRPGASFHVGAGLPMTADPGRGQTDTLGRPAGTGKVHVVDATVLPAIPATTITFPVMANAHRIASLAPD